MKFSDRRGHHKLKLSSKKYYRARPRKKRQIKPASLPVSIPLKNVSVFKISLPLDLISFKVSVPISVCVQYIFLFEVIKGWLRGCISMDKKCRHFQFQVIDCSRTSWNTLVFGHCRIIYLHIIILQFPEEGEFNLSSDIKKISSQCISRRQVTYYRLAFG